MKGRRVVAMMLILVMLVSGVLKSEAASGKVIRLFGIHEMNNGVDSGHSVMCNWMETAKYYQKADSTVDIDKRHHATAESIHGTLTRANCVIIKTHGNPEEISGYNGTRLTIDNIKSGKRMEKLEVCFVGACCSSNVAKEINNMGAAATIGYRETVGTEANARMLRHFNKYLALGESVTLAMFDAKNAMINKGLPLGDTDKYDMYGFVHHKLWK